MEGLCSGLGGLGRLVDGGGMFGGDGWLSRRHGFTEFGDGLDSCIEAAEERGEGARASGGQKAACGGAYGGHCGLRGGE